MNYYGYPPGYDPSPHHPRPSTGSGQAPTPPTAPIPPNVKARAQQAGATHISPDGKAAFVERMGKWYSMDWDGVTFGCWWLCGDRPDGAVQL